MFGRRARVKCFNATYHAGSYAGRADLGYRVVPVAQIVGSVGRCGELDGQFHSLRLTPENEDRLARIRRLAEEGVVLPPVELYKLKDEYFVVDGNHRVAVAKENGAGDIDAHVVEFLPTGERVEDRLYLERHAFAAETGLDGIRLAQLGGYGRLRQEIEEYRQGAGVEVDLRHAAREWHGKVYAPVAASIAVRRLEQRTGRSAADLYLDLSVQRAYARRQEGREPSWEELLARLEALYPMPSWRQRLAQGWRRLLGAVRAWWHGLRAEDLPCSYAGRASDGTIFCRRADRARRGIF